MRKKIEVVLGSEAWWDGTTLFFNLLLFELIPYIKHSNSKTEILYPNIEPFSFPNNFGRSRSLKQSHSIPTGSGTKYNVT